MGVQVMVPGPGAFSAHVDDAALQTLPGVSAASILVTLGNDGARLGKPALSVWARLMLVGSVTPDLFRGNG
jgi:hypothetical protein